MTSQHDTSRPHLCCEKQKSNISEILEGSEWPTYVKGIEECHLTHWHNSPGIYVYTQFNLIKCDIKYLDYHEIHNINLLIFKSNFNFKCQQA